MNLRESNILDKFLANEMARLEKEMTVWNRINGTKRQSEHKIEGRYARFVRALSQFAQAANSLLTNALARIGLMKCPSSPAPASERMPSVERPITITMSVVENSNGGKQLYATAVANYAEYISIAFVNATIEALQKEIVKRVADDVMDDVLKMVNIEAIVGALTLKVAEEVAKQVAKIPAVAVQQQNAQRDAQWQWGLASSGLVGKK